MIIIGICCEMCFVGMNLVIKINNIIVIVIGYIMFNIGIDIEIIVFKFWLVIIKFIKMKININVLYDILGMILWKYLEIVIISLYVVVRYVNVIMMFNKYFLNELNFVEVIVVNKYVLMFWFLDFNWFNVMLFIGIWLLI